MKPPSLRPSALPTLSPCCSPRPPAFHRSYDIFLFSKPDTLLAWASLPVVKLQQARYVNDGLKAVEAAAKRA